jgi:hypothetical protein
MRPSTAVPTALNRAKSTLADLAAVAAGLLVGVVAAAGRLRARGAALARGPVRRAIRGPLVTLVLGRRAARSVTAVALGGVLAAATAVAVATTTGYHALAEWTVGTWTGTDPRAAIFVGGALLVALAAASAAANDGVVPTALLVAGPLFGAVVTRYGTTVSTYGGARVVSLPEAVAVAAGVAAVGGAAVTAVGYPLGVACRRAVRIVRASAPSPFGG